MAESVTMAIAGHTGRGEAKRIIDAASGGAADSGRPFRDVLMEDETVNELLGPEGIDRALDPEGYLGSAGAFVDQSAGALRGGTSVTDDAHERGMKARREVLGDDHVDRAIARTTEFTADYQDLITRYAWGEIWARPGLDRRTRSAMTLTALIALGRRTSWRCTCARRAATG